MKIRKMFLAALTAVVMVVSGSAVVSACQGQDACCISEKVYCTHEHKEQYNSMFSNFIDFVRQYDEGRLFETLGAYLSKGYVAEFEFDIVAVSIQITLTDLNGLVSDFYIITYVILPVPFWQIWCGQDMWRQYRWSQVDSYPCSSNPRCTVNLHWSIYWYGCSCGFHGSTLMAHLRAVTHSACFMVR
jgi:hypothetical protein